MKIFRANSCGICSHRKPLLQWSYTSRESRSISRSISRSLPSPNTSLETLSRLSGARWSRVFPVLLRLSFPLLSSLAFWSQAAESPTCHLVTPGVCCPPDASAAPPDTQAVVDRGCSQCNRRILLNTAPAHKRDQISHFISKSSKTPAATITCCILWASAARARKETHALPPLCKKAIGADCLCMCEHLPLARLLLPCTVLQQQGHHLLARQCLESKPSSSPGA